MEILTLIGIILFPIATLGFVLMYFGHPVLALIAFISSIRSFMNKNRTE